MKIEDLNPVLQDILAWESGDSSRSWSSYWSGNNKGEIELYPIEVMPEALATSCVITDERLFGDQFMTVLYLDRLSLHCIDNLHVELISRPLTTDRDEFVAWARMALRLRGDL